MTSILDTKARDNELQGNVIKAIESYFPGGEFRGNKNTLILKDVVVQQDCRPGDIESQYEAVTKERSWGNPIYGNFELKDNATGSITGRAKVRLGTLPAMTERFAYIVGGTHYQTDSQLRLDSGAYARKKASGELETQVNLEKGQGFRIAYEPRTKKFKFVYGSNNVPAYVVMSSLGVTDEEMSKMWGPEIMAANRKAGMAEFIKKAKSMNKRANPTTNEEARDVIRAIYADTAISKETTNLTLGKPFSKVDGEMLSVATTKLLNIHRGKDTVDNRDSFEFKTIWNVEDHIPERIKNSKRAITSKLRNNVDRFDTPDRVVPRNLFEAPIHSFFTSGELAQQPNQTNIAEMVNGVLRTTVLGQGGIGSEQSVTQDAKLLDGSQVGILDPVATPEGGKTGITRHFTYAAHKNGHDVSIPVFNQKTKSLEYKTAKELALSTVAFADSYEWGDDGKPKPRESTVVAVLPRESDPAKVLPGNVDYILRHPSQLFSFTAAMIPFLPSVQPNRAEMATRHIEQAIPLKVREAPLVQVLLSDSSKSTIEQGLGKLAASYSPVDGKVIKVTPTKITVKDKAGDTFTQQLYNYFPLNHKKGFITSFAKVKVGDTVTKGQLLADSNFTDNGTYAFGRNMTVAMLPWHGKTFEDGIVLSESAAKAYTSEHMYKPTLYADDDTVVDLKRFRAIFPEAIRKDNLDKLDENGIIKVGSTVNQGDLMVPALKKKGQTAEQVLLRGISKNLVREYGNASIVWDKPTQGVVRDVIKSGNIYKILVTTDEPAAVGDKFAGRYGNKGVCTHIAPDNEMPRTKDGVPVDIIVNTSGVPGRINVGQVHELKLGKVAKKTGEIVSVQNFQTNGSKKLRTVQVAGHYRTIKGDDGLSREVWVEPYSYDREYNEVVDDVMARAGVTGTEELFDPTTLDESGKPKSFGQVLVGEEYYMKLLHQVNKKVSARDHGAGFAYDSSAVPKGGGSTGAQKFGGLGLFAMLAHGSTENIRDGLTYKSDQTQKEVWAAIQNGTPLPPPRPSYAYDKFLGYLFALGINVEKQGDILRMIPATQKDILEKSSGELKEPTRVLRGKDGKPEAGGLFDEEVLGGMDGKKWGHFNLALPVPNPMMEPAILSLLGLKKAEFDDVLRGNTQLDKNGRVVQSGGLSGSSAIAAALENIDVGKEYKKTVAALDGATGSDLNRLNKRAKILRALENSGMSAKDAYMLSSIPVLPPVYRPISLLQAQNLSVDGLNQHYRNIALINESLKSAKGQLPDEMLSRYTGSLYGAVAQFMGTTTGDEPLASDPSTTAPPGVMDIISGSGGPKTGFYLKQVVDRKQDSTMRSVIVPNKDLSLNEIGLPRASAMIMYKPFVEAKLIQGGKTVLEAQKEISSNTQLANRALELAVAERPVLFKRDPVLWKYGIQGFNVVLHPGKAIEINPLTVGGFNADFDGDTMGVFLPISDGAVREAKRMMPKNNMFNPGSDRVMYGPSLEGQLGLFLLSQMGKPVDKSYKSLTDLVEDFKKGGVKASDVVTVKDMGGIKTTAGRASIYTSLPEKIRSEDILVDPNKVLNSKGFSAIMTRVGKETPEKFTEVSDRFTQLGWGYSHAIGFSFKDDDFTPLRNIRDKHIKAAEERLSLLPRNTSQKDRNAAIIAAYSKATKDMSAEAREFLSKSDNNLYTMHLAGIKPGWEQLQQLLLAPMLVQNAKGDIIPVPLTKSYTEGLQSDQYWTASSGAMKGLIEKVQSVAKPGALSKQIMNVTLPIVVTKNDCGTQDGIKLDISHPDLMDRLLAKSVKIGNKTLPAGTVLNPSTIATIKSSGVSDVVVRSPLKCSQPKGMCAYCYGLTPEGTFHQKGAAIGVIAGQAIGERGTQLSMKQFHMGGVAGASSGVVNALERITQLLKVPEVLPDSATLAAYNGKVTEIKPSVSGGWDIKIDGGKELMYVPGFRQLNVKVGDVVSKGDKLSDGVVNPRDLLELTSLSRTQKYLSDELYDVYKSEGVRRRNVEVLIRGMTNLARVDDAGDAPGILRGDLTSLSELNHMNKTLKKPVKFTPVLKGLDTLPLDSSEDWAARLHYRRQKDTLQSGVAQQWGSDIHGVNPVPGIIYSKEFGKGNKDDVGVY